MPPTPTPSPVEEAVTRVQTFVEENKRLVIGAAVVAAVGVGYFAYSASRGSGGADKGGKKAGKDLRKDKKGGKKTKAGRGLDKPDGPLLEERSSDEGTSFSHLIIVTQFMRPY